MKDSSNIISFFEDEQFVKFGKELECSTADLYSGYCYWCGLTPTGATIIYEIVCLIFE